jgi:hypothetical protein
MKVTEKLSKSIICNWEIKKTESRDTTPDLINIISVVYFLPEKGATKMDKYYMGLKDIIKKIPKILNNFKLRIYYDQSVENKVNKLVNELVINKDYIELYKYDIPSLKDNNGYHRGKIGTLLRFLPLYDNPIHRANKIIIFDIDNVLHFWYKIIIKYFMNNKIKFSYRTRGCYGIRKRVICTEIKYHPIIASFIYQSINLPYSLFSDFIENMFIIKNERVLLDNCGLENEYSYGIDEIYINKYHLIYFYKNKIDIYPILFNNLDILTGLKDYVYLLSTPTHVTLYINFLNKIFKIFNIKYDLLQLDTQNTNIILLKTQLEEILNDNKYWEINREKIFNILNKSKPKELYQLLLEALKSNNQLPEIKLLIKCLLINIQLELNKINIFKIKTDYKNKPIINKTEQIKLRY